VRRGQAVSTDYIVGVAIFLLLLGAITMMWEKTVYRVAADYKIREMTYATARAADLLVKSPGTPNNWEQNTSTLKAVGAAQDDRVLSDAKLTSITGLNYTAVRKYLGVGEFDVYVRVENATGSLKYELGSPPNGEITVNVRRYCTLNGVGAVVDVRVWDGGVGSALPPVYEIR